MLWLFKSSQKASLQNPLFTFTSFFCSMNALMSFKTFRGVKEFAAFTAFVSFLSVMGSVMVFKMWQSTEGTTTLFTSIRSLFKIFLVISKVCVATEGFSTFVTLVRFFCRVSLWTWGTFDSHHGMFQSSKPQEIILRKILRIWNQGENLLSYFTCSTLKAS